MRTQWLRVWMASSIAATLALVSLPFTAQGATRSITVTPEVAAPGDEVSVALHDYGGAYRGTDLYLVLASSWVEVGSPCNLMPGAVKVSTIVWTDNDPYHDGYAEFVMPAVADGDYLLGEDVPGITCAPGGSINVSASRTSTDTAAKQPGSVRTLITVAGLILLVTAGALATRRLTRSSQDAPKTWPRV